MGLEIERKYLVDGESWRDTACAGVPMLQGYVSVTPEHTVRVRVAGTRGFLTLKGGHCGIRRQEFEYEIPETDAREMLMLFCRDRLVSKVRYPVMVGGRLWTVDVFDGNNRGLVVAEIELPSEETAFPMPEWAGAEVSGDRRYSNAALSARPYVTWQ